MLSLSVQIQFHGILAPGDLFRPACAPHSRDEFAQPADLLERFPQLPPGRKDCQERAAAPSEAAPVLVERQRVIRPITFVGLVAYSQVEGLHTVRNAIPNQVLHQDPPRGVARPGTSGVCRQQGIETVLEHQAEMRRNDPAVHRERRDMAAAAIKRQAAEGFVEIKQPRTGVEKAFPGRRHPSAPLLQCQNIHNGV